MLIFAHHLMTYKSIWVHRQLQGDECLHKTLYVYVYVYYWYSLWVKWGGLSLTSVSFTVTVVVPESPPRWPPMSLAWSTMRYWSWASLSKSGTAVRKIPERKWVRKRIREMKSNNTAARPLSRVFNPQLHAWVPCCLTCKAWWIKMSITSISVI